MLLSWLLSDWVSGVSVISCFGVFSEENKSTIFSGKDPVRENSQNSSFQKRWLESLEKETHPFLFDGLGRLFSALGTFELIPDNIYFLPGDVDASMELRDSSSSLKSIGSIL